MFLLVLDGLYLDLSLSVGLWLVCFSSAAGICNWWGWIMAYKTDAWSVLRNIIDAAYGREPGSFGDINNYYYCGKRLDTMTREQCILALTEFKIPCDEIK